MLGSAAVAQQVNGSLETVTAGGQVNCGPLKSFTLITCVCVIGFVLLKGKHEFLTVQVLSISVLPLQPFKTTSVKPKVAEHKLVPIGAPFMLGCPVFSGCVANGFK